MPWRLFLWLGAHERIGRDEALDGILKIFCEGEYYIIASLDARSFCRKKARW